LLCKPGGVYGTNFKIALILRIVLNKIFQKQGFMLRLDDEKIL